MNLYPPPLSLYIHIPWCVRKCPYCDFNSHQRPESLPIDAYVDALIADLEQDLPLVWGRTIHSVFFGGGTPSLFPAAAIARILEAASARLRFAPGVEITLECNPGTAEFDRFEGYLAAGVNRLSFGIQSFDDGCLIALGRIHDSSQAEQAVRKAQAAGYQNINLDLMYALPGQTISMALNDVACAVALAPTHISHYHLTLEPNTLFATKPPSGLPDEDTAWIIQERCQQALADSGYAQYEVSAYARDHQQCAHNLNYWRFGDYLGIGAGAHGKISQGSDGSILRRWKIKQPRDYLQNAGSDKRIGADQKIDLASRPFEYMLNRLRLKEAFSLDEFEARTGIARAAIDAQVNQAIANQWLIQTVTENNKVWLSVSELGQRFNNDLVSLFLVG